MASSQRQPVPKGGLWSSGSQQNQQNVSKETRELLKEGQSLPVDRKLPQSAKAKSAEKQKGPIALNGRSLQSGKRKKDVIDALNEQQSKDTYKPSPGKIITDKDKEKLQNMMAYGKDHEKIARKQPVKRVAEKTDVDKDRFDEVMEEIEERRRFLDEMEAIGQGAKYKSVIATEISQKIRELEVIDKERSSELERVLKTDSGTR
eukprot:gene8880-9830_t